MGVNEGAIVNISVDGEVQTTAQVTGGVVGENSGTLANVASAVDVTGGLFTGASLGLASQEASRGRMQLAALPALPRAAGGGRIKHFTVVRHRISGG